MTSHIVCRVGAGDDFTPSIFAPDTLLPVSIEQAGAVDAAGTKIRDVLEKTAIHPLPAAIDLLNFATAVYSADVCTRRRTAYDRWTRDFRLYFPVTNVEQWSSASEHLCGMLSFLSGDRWNLEFRALMNPVPEFVARKRAIQPQRPSAVSLFSGGLDSFVGAIDLLESRHLVSLVGHYSTGPTSNAQDAVHAALAKQYPDRTSLFRCYIRPPHLHGSEPEPSTRSRSILFLALGTLIASSFGEPIPLFVPENGLISLNVPLTPARSGTLSTRTTHPHFMDLFRAFLRLIGLSVPVETPYRFQTKGEMLAYAKNIAFLRTVASKTLSCSHPDVGRYIGIPPGRNCGYCVPCLIRRASMAHIDLDNPAEYLIDVLRAPPKPGTDTGMDLRAFEIAVSRFRSGTNPLFDVLSSGPIPPEDVSEFVAVYSRGMAEVDRFLHPQRTQ